MTSHRFSGLADDDLQIVSDACDEFEAGLEKEESPSIEDYLRTAPSQLKEYLFCELLAIELESQSARGSAPARARYDDRFPDRRDDVRTVFDRVFGELSTRYLGDSAATDRSAEAQRLSAEMSAPTFIGRYRVDSKIGKGGFGVVYKAHDDDLDREVAIKVPHAALVIRPDDAELYRVEAKTVARLDHPNIVPVYDIGSSDEFPVFVVSKFIDASNLASLLRINRPDQRGAAELVTTVAEALHYAHQKGLVHRDVKPGNILIDSDGVSHLADFGLALHDEDVGLGPRYAGTPAYMSPEVASGEGHRVDGRSDVFSLGVVLYEMLTGRRPFRGTTQAEVLEQVTTCEPQSLRQYDEPIAPDLERICLKALSKRASSRFASAHEMATDLRLFLASSGVSEPSSENLSRGTSSDIETTPSSQSSSSVRSDSSLGLASSGRPARIVPRGLRSFGGHDADFFVELLPGPRDRDGLPESIHFWKSKVEEQDSISAFSVGLIYGPSGCGKTSLIKAGLLPRLSSEVASVYVESTGRETESQLLHRLQQLHPALQGCDGLKATLAALRRGRGLRTGHKVLIVLDQFEQWLHNRDSENTELLQALRQCDGDHVQCILMVRDDFWLAVSRFMLELEVDLVPNQNVLLVDLFDAQHAGKVLAAFGRAYEKLPDNPEEMPKQQKDFLKHAVDGLAVEGRVVCVRLALFAEMMKDKAWTTATLRDVGGAKGLGIKFLEETFSASTADSLHRRHEKAARGVLGALLPESGTDIKGQMQSHDELLVASGYESSSREFEDLLRILDRDIRIVTPADDFGVNASNDNSDTDDSVRHYQLSHDYLVQPLREWLMQKQRETKRGRAELRLAEQSSLWNANPESRYLPSLLEWVRICRRTDRTHWKDSQRQMMRKATQRHCMRLAFLGLAAIVAVSVGISLFHLSEQRKDGAESSRLVDGLLKAETSQVGSFIVELRDYQAFADDDLKAAYRSSADGSNAKLHAGLALATHDESVVGFLAERLLRVSASQFRHVSDLLVDHQPEVVAAAQGVLSDPTQVDQLRFQAACVLATYHREDELWRGDFAEFVANYLVNVEPADLQPWTDALRPVKQHLVVHLGRVYRDQGQRESARWFATVTLADYAKEDAGQLAELLVDADPRAFEKLFPVVGQHGSAAKERLRELFGRRLDPEWNDSPLSSEWQSLPASIGESIEAANGVVDERFAFAPSLLWSEFLELTEPFQASGYRPTRVRPYRETSALGDDGEIPAQSLTRVAVVWRRDGKRYNVEVVTAEQIPRSDADASKGGLIPVDFSAMPTGEVGMPTNDSPQSFVILWAESDNDDERRRLLFDASAEEIFKAQKQMTNDGFVSQATIAVWTVDDAQRRYAGIWSTHGAPSGNKAAYPGFELLHRPQWDVATDSNAAAVVSSPGYAAVWHADVEYESRTLTGVANHLLPQQATKLVESGFRPVALAVLKDTSTSVWHRPLVAEDAFDKLAQQQATAATALLRLDDSEPVMPTFRLNPDPRLRSYLLHQLVAYGVDPKFLIESLEKESDVSSQRALILAIGDMVRRGKLTTIEEVKSQLIKLHQENVDAGIHGATAWTLRQMGEESEIARVREQYSTGKVDSDRQWYLTRETGQEMIVLDAADEFLMSSPVTEIGRFLGPGGDNERRHRRRIDRKFAIGAREVTVAQYQQFRPNHEFDRATARESDTPANMVSWYQAAAYCNWLSEKEGLPPEEWCYNPDEEFAGGMTLLPDYLHRTGYRLPSEAEWEYASRAGAVTARYFGETPELMDHYCWHAGTSDKKFMLPVGSLMPNDFGLFDILGNAMEWTQDRAVLFKTESEFLADVEVPGKVNDSQSHIFRGGSFGSLPAGIRSSSRLATRPGGQMFNGGFRLARTQP